MWGVAPICTKYTCLLDNVMFKDQDTIAEVYHEMTLLISEKNAIKKQLMKVGMQLAHDIGTQQSHSQGGITACFCQNDSSMIHTTCPESTKIDYFAALTSLHRYD